jgi:hypothetical protein
VTVDGDLSDWPELPYAVTDPVEINMDRSTWDGPEDCSFRFALAHDEEYVYVAVDVLDEAHVFEPGRPRAWHQDGVEIRIDARPDPQRSENTDFFENRHKDFLLIGLSPGHEPGQMLFMEREQQPVKVRAACVKTPTGHATEIAVPVAYLSEKQGGPWRRFRLNVGVDDYDDLTPGARGVQLMWHPNWSHSESFAGSGTFRRTP